MEQGLIAGWRAEPAILARPGAAAPARTADAAPPLPKSRILGCALRFLILILILILIRMNRCFDHENLED